MCNRLRAVINGHLKLKSIDFAFNYHWKSIETSSNIGKNWSGTVVWLTDVIQPIGLAPFQAR